jgi:hypothetical protein
MHAAYREELGPLSAEPNVDGPGWLRALVVAADRPRLRPPLVAALRAAHLVAGRLHHWGAEEGFALAVRAIGQRAGVREGERELRPDVTALPPRAQRAPGRVKRRVNGLSRCVPGSSGANEPFRS